MARGQQEEVLHALQDLNGVIEDVCTILKEDSELRNSLIVRWDYFLSVLMEKWQKAIDIVKEIKTT